MDFNKINESFANFNVIDDVERRFEAELKEFVSYLNQNLMRTMRWGNEEMKVVYIPSFKHWLVVVGSRFYKDDETTMFVYSLKNGLIHRECPSFFPNNVYEDAVFNDNYWETVAPKEYISLFQLPSFVTTMRTYEELSQKDPFELEIFFDNKFRYSPYNLVINVSHDEFNALRRTRHINIAYANLIHQPGSLQDYVGKLGEINGFVCRITQIIDANYITIQLDE